MMIGENVYIVERCGFSRLSTPEFVDAYSEHADAKEFCKKKNDSNKSCYTYTVRTKKVK